MDPTTFPLSSSFASCAATYLAESGPVGLVSHSRRARGREVERRVLQTGSRPCRQWVGQSSQSLARLERVPQLLGIRHATLSKADLFALSEGEQFARTEWTARPRRQEDSQNWADRLAENMCSFDELRKRSARTECITPLRWPSAGRG